MPPRRVRPRSDGSSLLGDGVLPRLIGGEPGNCEETLSPTDGASQGETAEDRSHACSVCLRSTASIMAPTPPGEGDTTGAAGSESTSLTSSPSTRLIPTLLVTAPVLATAPGITRRRPGATPRMLPRHPSGPPKCLGRSRASHRRGIGTWLTGKEMIT